MTPEGLQRRSVLGKLLAVGGALCLPLLAACGKKSEPEKTPAESPLTSNAPPAGESGSAMQAAAPAPAGEKQGKLAQSAVQYQDHPSGDQSCSNCLHYHAADNSCELVAGPIAPNGWCTIWVKQG